MKFVFDVLCDNNVITSVQCKFYEMMIKSSTMFLRGNMLVN